MSGTLNLKTGNDIAERKISSSNQPALKGRSFRKDDMKDLADALVASGALASRELFDMWHTRLFADPVVGSWDTWLDPEWRKKPRDSFESIADFYDSDAFVCFMAGVLPGWPAGHSVPFANLPLLGARVLDFGCGHGRDGMYCLNDGAHVTFADVSPRLLMGVAAFCEANDFDVVTQRITEEVPTLGTQQYDFVITCDALEHVQQPVAVLQRLVVSMKIGGYLWMTVTFNGHVMAPYHLPHNFHLGVEATWREVCVDIGLQPVGGRDRVYRRVR